MTHSKHFDAQLIKAQVSKTGFVLFLHIFCGCTYFCAAICCLVNKLKLFFVMFLRCTTINLNALSQIDAMFTEKNSITSPNETFFLLGNLQVISTRLLNQLKAISHKHVIFKITSFESQRERETERKHKINQQATKDLRRTPSKN